MQIHLTYRNSLRNVKRRVLHTRGLAMYYITRRVLVAGIPPHQQAKASPLHAVNIKIQLATGRMWGICLVDSRDFPTFAYHPPIPTKNGRAAKFVRFRGCIHHEPN